MNYLDYRRALKLKSPQDKVQDRVQQDLAKKKPLPRESAKRKAEKPEYEKVKKEARKKIQRCQIAIANVCTGGPLEAHHPEGRSGKALMKVIMCCRACHDFVHDHPAFAKRFGFSESRTKTPDKFQHLKK